MANFNNIPDFIAMGEQLKKDLVADMEKQGMDFIHANFKDEAFIDTSLEQWPQRKHASDFGLLRVSNTLFNSISATSDKMSVTFEADAPYAQIHNEGGTITITVSAQMKRYFWAMFKTTGQERWKWMAMMKEGKTMQIKIPKRQFMGHSEHFLANFEAHIIGEIQRRFKQL